MNAPWGVLTRRLRQRRWLQEHRDLATANGLSPAEARLLWRIGVGAGLDNPAMVFVRPTLFESRALLLGADLDLIESIRGKVFGAR